MGMEAKRLLHTLKNKLQRKNFIYNFMVGIVRIELTTPCVSSKCSTTELDALKINNGGR